MGKQRLLSAKSLSVNMAIYPLSSCFHNLGHWTFSGTCCLGDEITLFLFSPEVKQDLYFLLGSHNEQIRTTMQFPVCVE